MIADTSPPDAQEPGTAELRVLSHPTRLAFLRYLRTHGAATARALGRAFDLDSGAASYHLRRLAAGGLIEEDPDLGTRRERFWRPSGDVTQFDPAQHDEDSARAYIRANLISVATDLQHVAAAATTASEEWLAQSVFIDHRLDLDDDAAAELRAEMLALVARYRDRAAHGSRPGSRPPLVAQLQLYRRP